ncbi:unnamed protein product [Prunus armeniaca]
MRKGKRKAGMKEGVRWAGLVGATSGAHGIGGSVAATLVVVVGMWCSSLLCPERRTMLGHRRFSLSGSELKWSASHGSFYCCFCVPPPCSLLVSAMSSLVGLLFGVYAVLLRGSTVLVSSCGSYQRSLC